MKVLIIEDEINLVNILTAYLKKENIEVDFSHDGIEGLEKYKTFKPDIVILDLMLPGKTGEEVCEIIRKESNTYIIITTAKSKEESAIKCFNLGADDYIRKPFSPKELIEKIKNVYKRIGKLEVDDNLKEIYLNRASLNLTKNEYKILKLLIENPNIVFSREKIIENLFSDYDSYDRTIDAYIKNIRKKSGSKIIKTVHGLGYKLGDLNETEE